MKSLQTASDQAFAQPGQIVLSRVPATASNRFRGATSGVARPLFSSMSQAPSEAGFTPAEAQASRRRGRSGGFTLIEVVMALGIVSFAFLTMTGLISLGLDNFHDGLNMTVSSQIAQQMINSVQQTDFNQLSTLGAQTYYFDNQGNQLGATNKAHAVYQTYLTIQTSTQLPGAAANTDLATVTLQVARNPGNMTVNWASPPAGLSVTTYSTQVANDN